MTTSGEIAITLAKYRPLRSLIKQVGPPPRRKVSSVVNRYPALVGAIVYQQLAGRAAASIHGRLIEGLDNDVNPGRMLTLTNDECATFGLSRAKRDSIRDLSVKTLEGAINFSRHGRMTDGDVVAELVQVRGIGPWTAQMYLMHDLGRHDVWPTLDYGVRKGWSLLHGMDEMITTKAMGNAADHLAPYRSSVAWYCWQAVDLR
jgi:3-methyladenine DNA glycosylase/8-oxoguanine DNA glycosylase